MKKRMRKAVAIAATAAMVGSLPAGGGTAQGGAGGDLHQHRQPMTTSQSAYQSGAPQTYLEARVKKSLTKQQMLLVLM